MNCPSRISRAQTAKSHLSAAALRGGRTHAVPTFFIAIAFLVLLIAVVDAAHAQIQTEEYRVKAAFLFHFAQLVDWPPEALGDEKNPLTLCTVGKDPFHGDLEATVEGKSIGTHALRVRHFKEAREIQGCQVLFVSGSERSDVPVLIAGLKNDAVLTVGETNDFVKQGGMIGFSVESNKVRFEINMEAAERAKLKISSRLLLLAKNVIGNHS